jgi:hypothetical protein
MDVGKVIQGGSLPASPTSGEGLKIKCINRIRTLWKNYQKTFATWFQKYPGKNSKKLNVHRSVHRNSILLYIQQDANVTQFILSTNCSTCFGWYHHPSSEAQTTVSTASGICHAVTVVCAPDDEWKYHPKHVEQFLDKINCVTLHLVGHTCILELQDS